MNRDDIVTAMADIALPPAPDWYPVIVIAVVILIALALGALLTRRYIRRRGVSRDHLAATARLDRLERAWMERTLDEREAGYRLATLLRLGLRMQRLQADGPPHACTDAREWANTVALLQRLRYRRHPDAELTPEIFEQARRWLTSPVPRRGENGP